MVPLSVVVLAPVAVVVGVIVGYVIGYRSGNPAGQLEALKLLAGRRNGDLR